MAYDPTTKHVILLGGGAPNSDPGKHDMWSWDGITWTELHPATMPTTWVAPAITDYSRSAVILIAPDINGNAGFWQWTESDWTYVTTQGFVNPPHDFGFAYDPDRHEDVLAAGWTALGPQGGADDTWVLHDQTWTKPQMPSTSPRGIAHAAYDQARHYLLLLANSDQAPTDWADATWTWDGTSWTRHFPSHRPPGGLTSQTMVYDPIGGHVVMFGGKSDELGAKLINQVWAWNGDDWVQLS